ncbi:MAG TPA: acyltransferase [Deltaproteobacteria bacterium]|nr:acyltransferase [Deltaproteobacteria bacterium]
MKGSVKTAGIQMSPTAVRARNLKVAGSLIAAAAERGARVICLPQLFSTPWFPAVISKDNFRWAEPEDGETVSFLREAARRAGSVVIAPIFERDGGRFYNTAFVIDEGGAVLGRYRKVHVPQLPFWEEKAYFSPGDLGFPVFETSFGTVGVLLCWDVFFPEGFRILALKGVQMVFVPTASAYVHSRRKWERAAAASAQANGIYVFRVNRTGSEGEQEFYGASFCAGPGGDLVEGPAGASEGVVLADLDLHAISAVRNEWVFLKDRRPDQYGELTEVKR